MKADIPDMESPDDAPNNAENFGNKARRVTRDMTETGEDDTGPIGHPSRTNQSGEHRNTFEEKG
jgi:hypothetical protein